MSYVLNRTNGDILTVILDTDIDQLSTDLTFVGNSVPNYGEYINENFIKLLENFSNVTQPNHPIMGQLWYDESTAQLKVYDGIEFRSTSSVIVSGSLPAAMNPGDFWFDSIRKQMYFYDGSTAQLVGPLYNSSQGLSGFKTETILDTNNESHTVLKLYVGDTLLGIYSNDTFIPAPQYIESGISLVEAGFTAIREPFDAKYNGIARSAESLIAADLTEVTVEDIVVKAGDNIVSGRLQLLTAPESDFDVTNVLAVKNLIKQNTITMSINTTGLSHSNIINEYITPLYPASNYSDLDIGPEMNIISLDTGVMFKYIISNGLWTYDRIIRQNIVGPSTVELVTTNKMPIVNNKCLLPSTPAGDIVWNVALVYYLDTTAAEHDNVSVVIEDGLPFLVFNDSIFSGGETAVVSYNVAI